MIIGGYGQDSKLRQNRTFDTLLRIPVKQFCAVVLSGETPAKKAAAINAMVARQHDPFFSLTGCALPRGGAPFSTATRSRNSLTATPSSSTLSRRCLARV